MKTYPKIGIRPTIDGRWGGVRESLEAQTMAMAQSAKALIEANVFYADGTPVQCIIAPTIGGGEEAARAAALFAKENVTATLTVTPCWCYGSETMDLDPLTVKAVWGFNGTERPGAVYLAAVMSAHAQRGLPAFAIYGHDVQDAGDTSIPADVSDKLLRFARCAVAVGAMKNRAYVNLGSVSMGIMGSYCDMKFLQDYFGIRAEFVDMTEILRRITLEIYDPAEYAVARKWVAEHCKAGMDVNAGKDLPEIIKKSRTVSPKESEWDFVTKAAMIMRDIINGNPKLAELGWHEEALGRNGIAGGFQGQRQWTDWLPNGDFAEAVLCSSFDWNGKKEPMVVATENDGLNGMAMLFTKLLTGTASVFADVRTYWSPDAVKRVTGYTMTGKAADGIIHLINSGAAALDGCGAAKMADGSNGIKRWWEMTDADIDAVMNAIDWPAANAEYFRGGGFSSHFRTDYEMPVTMVRLNLVAGVGPVLQFAEGYTVTLPQEVHKALDERTDRTWPTTWFAPRTGTSGCETVYDVMANWGANHGAFCYGHVGADLVTLASMLRIPVSLHNLSDEALFRPHAWAAFGTRDAEGADYRACAAYGALYK
ncbi:MAG: L-fucose isomerase [Oscillospiraceae bacterium]|nr:L-fucose isomerase [Oscillospiraceae bacterium]